MSHYEYDSMTSHTAFLYIVHDKMEIDRKTVDVTKTVNRVSMASSEMNAT